MKKIFIILGCATWLILLPFLGYCEDLSSGLKDEHVPVTENRLKAIGDMIQGPQFDFQEVIKLLKEDKFQEAGIMLNARIATLKNLLENRWQMTDHQPKIADCLTLSYFINIYLGNIKAAETDADYLINKLKFPNTGALINRLQDFVQEAKQDKVKFGDTIKRLSESMWEYKDS